MYAFEFIGERLCLDFCNTLSNRTHPPTIEHLPDFAELLRWAAAAGTLTTREVGKLGAEAAAHPREARRVLERAWSLRNALFRLVTSNEVAGDLDLVNREIGEAMAHTVLDRDGAGYRIRLAAEPRPLSSVLWPVARSILELFTSDELARVKLCDAFHSGECAWLFFDDTRNGTRRWCSMADCGNRAKARRHYQRHKS